MEGLLGFLVAVKTKGRLKRMAVPVPEAGGEGVGPYIPSPQPLPRAHSHHILGTQQSCRFSLHLGCFPASALPVVVTPSFLPQRPHAHASSSTFPLPCCLFSPLSLSLSPAPACEFSCLVLQQNVLSCGCASYRPRPWVCKGEKTQPLPTRSLCPGGGAGTQQVHAGCRGHSGKRCERGWGA